MRHAILSLRLVGCTFAVVGTLLLCNPVEASGLNECKSADGTATCTCVGGCSAGSSYCSCEPPAN
jgi:hypothetical protein